MVAYVDGSYDHEKGVYGYGIVAIHPDGRVEHFAGAGNKEETAALRNVAGETIAAMTATRYAIQCGYENIKIFYDYSGIENWVTGAWKAKKNLTIKYSTAMREWADKINIQFEKVAAHTGNMYNETADSLAKSAICTFLSEETKE